MNYYMLFRKSAFLISEDLIALIPQCGKKINNKKLTFNLFIALAAIREKESRYMFGGRGRGEVLMRLQLEKKKVGMHHDAQALSKRGHLQ